MASKTRLIQFVSAIVLSLLSLPGFAGDLLAVRSVDTSAWETAGEISVVVDAWAGGVPVHSAGAAWTMDIPGAETASSVRVEPFSTEPGRTSVLVLVPGTPAFMEPSKKRRPPVDYVMEGIKSLRNSVANTDFLAVGCYGPAGGDPVALSGGIKQASRVQIPDFQAAAPICLSGSSDTGIRLPTVLSGVIKDWMARKPGMARYVVVVVSDGVSTERIPQQWWKGLASESYGPSWLDVAVAGFEDGGDQAGIEALGAGGALASAAVREEIPDVVASLGPAVSGRGLVKLTFRIGSRIIPDGSVMRVVMKTPEISMTSRDVPVGRLPARPGLFESLMPWPLVAIGVLLAGFAVTFLLLHFFWNGSAKKAVQAGSPFLVVVSGGGAGRVLPLREGESVAGSARNCDFRLNFKGVAPRHCVFCVGPAGIFVEDLGTPGAVRVNGRETRRACIRYGDVIAVGTQELMLKRTQCENSGNVTRNGRQPSLHR